MNCESFETRLNEVLDERGAIESDRPLLEHASSCATCRGLLASYAALLEGVDRLERPGLQQGVAERIVEQVRQPSVLRIKLTWQRAAVAGLAAAAALLVAVQWNLSPDAPNRPAARPVEQSVAQADAPVPQPALEPGAIAPPAGAPAADEEPLGRLLVEMKTKYADLARETQQSVNDVTLLVPGVTVGRQPEAVDAQPADSELRPKGWVNDVADGLSPITESTRGAFNLLLEGLLADAGEPRS